MVAFIAPICGTLADQKGFKKKLFVAMMLLGVIGCAALGAAWSWLSFLVIYVLAKVGYSSSLVFYDAMLPEVTTDARMDNVSSQGYAFGYIGSVIPFILCLVLVLLGDKIGLSVYICYDCLLPAGGRLVAGLHIAAAEELPSKGLCGAGAASH